MWPVLYYLFAVGTFLLGAGEDVVAAFGFLCPQGIVEVGDGDQVQGTALCEGG